MNWLLYALLAISSSVNILGVIGTATLREEHAALKAAYDASIFTNRACDGALVTCIGWQARLKWVLEERCLPK